MFLVKESITVGYLCISHTINSVCDGKDAEYQYKFLNFRKYLTKAGMGFSLIFLRYRN